MKKIYPVMIGVAMVLASCAPARTTLKNPQTGLVVICDAKDEKSEGMVGYKTGKTPSRECVEGYMGQGYDIISTER